MTDAALALKQLEGELAVARDRASALGGKLEDLLFRAQRIAHAHKNGLKDPDTMYGYDLQHFRRDLRAYAGDVGALPARLESASRSAAPGAESLARAQAVLRLCAGLAQAVRGLHDSALIAHQHIRAADHKIEAWAVVQELDELASRAQGLPGVAGKIVAVSGGTP